MILYDILLFHLLRLYRNGAPPPFQGKIENVYYIYIKIILYIYIIFNLLYCALARNSDQREEFLSQRTRRYRKYFINRIIRNNIKF